MKLTITLIAMLTATTAFADGPTPGTYDPPVIPPYQSSWAGAYGGVFAGGVRTQTSRQEHTGYIRECARIEGKWGPKCTVSQEDWNGSPELLALGEPVDGHPSKADRLDDDFRYDAGYSGVWVGNETGKLQYTSLTNEDIQSNYATNTVIGDVFKTVTETAEEGTGGAFIGYGATVGGAVIRAELSGTQDFAIAEFQVGYDLAALLPYVSTGVAYDGDQTAATWGAGFDYAVTGRIFTGVSYDAVPEWDTEVLAIRVGMKF